MLTTEFKMEDAIAVWIEEGLEIGEARGLEIGEARGEARVLTLLESGHTLSEIKDILQRERKARSN
jgi:hypothetical protein